MSIDRIKIVINRWLDRVECIEILVEILEDEEYEVNSIAMWNVVSSDASIFNPKAEKEREDTEET